MVDLIKDDETSFDSDRVWLILIFNCSFIFSTEPQPLFPNLILSHRSNLPRRPLPKPQIPFLNPRSAAFHHHPTMASSSTATKTTNTVYAPVIDKRKEPEVVDLAGSSTKSYVHVDHAQRRSEEDKELEDELNKDLVSNLDLQGFNVDSPNQVDTQISEDSEFVGDTQPPEVAAIDHVQQIPLVVQKDIEFLKESWANLAELEDNCALDLDPGIASMANKNPVSTGPAASYY
ncbi:hypothetical protein TSUD_292710 [Trifolium subterraneum]|uniref:Uncharacterized protein n=1 Tax=Trifolium subterraneum TaxID=3900 RepID=A0A2Z6N8U2_TRISU|nr:hypothetical protein TSUD_292710 [Trifolium subterraneum]